MKDIVSTDRAPSAIGPYSQAVKSNGFIFVSGQLPLDPATMELIPGDIASQTRKVLENATAILQAAGSSLEKVVKCTVLLQDMADFAAMNGVYAEFFNDNPPARAAYQVARLPKDALVEIEMIATI